MLAALCDLIIIAHPQPGVKCFSSEQQDFLWRHLSDGAAQFLEGSLFDTGDIAARQVHTAGDLVRGSGAAAPRPYRRRMTSRSRGLSEEKSARYIEE